MLIPAWEAAPRPPARTERRQRPFPAAPTHPGSFIVPEPSRTSQAEPQLSALGRSLFASHASPAGDFRLASARCAASPERGAGTGTAAGSGTRNSPARRCGVLRHPPIPTDPLPEPRGCRGMGVPGSRKSSSANPCPMRGGCPSGGSPLSAAGERWGARAGHLLSYILYQRHPLGSASRWRSVPGPRGGQGLRSGISKNPAWEPGKLCFEVHEVYVGINSTFILYLCFANSLMGFDREQNRTWSCRRCVGEGVF